LKPTPFIVAALLVALSAALAQPQPGTVLWSIDVVDGITSSPTVADDGTVYVSTFSGLLSLADHGSSVSTNWFFPAQTRSSGVSVGFDGTIYELTETNLWAINPDGSIRWTFPLPAGSLGVPAVGFDNTIYAVAGQSVWAVSSGNLVWSHDVYPNWWSGWDDYTGPSISRDNTIYVTTGSGLIALNSDGSEKWTMTGVGSGTPAIGADGTIYVSEPGLNAIRPDGTLKWQALVPARNSPVVGQNGNIYVGNETTTGLTALSPQGELIWDILPIPTWHTPPPNPAAAASGGVIYNAVSNSLFAVNLAGEVQWAFQSLGGYVGMPTIFQSSLVAPTIGPTGTIYVQIVNHVFAIAGTNSPADSPWPMYQQNARHTGKNEKPSLLNPHKRNDGSFEFQIAAQVGQSFTVQASTNLQDWSTVTNFVCDRLPKTLADPEATNFNSRFYRVVSP
jgi:putative pyrroloquinoline-quinone binding quinoprotein/putative pyrroloquinoline-quinone-binding quinoprotein